MFQKYVWKLSNAAIDGLACSNIIKLTPKARRIRKCRDFHPVSWYPSAPSSFKLWNVGHRVVVPSICAFSLSILCICDAYILTHMSRKEVENFISFGNKNLTSSLEKCLIPTSNFIIYHRTQDIMKYFSFSQSISFLDLYVLTRNICNLASKQFTFG